MAEKLPVVVGPDGRPRQLGSTDALTTNAVSGAVTTSNSGSFDLATSRRYLRVLNGSNSSLSLTNDSDGAAFGIILQQDGVGNRTVLWWSGIYWYGTASPTTPPVLNTAPAAYDYVGFIRLSAGSYLGYAAECSTTAASTAASGSTSNEITQTSHGFSVGDAVYHTGTAYAKAQANADATSEVIGVVSAVAGANVFSLLTNGRITGLTGLTAGAVYFLSASTAGALTATEPSTTGHVSKPVLVADSTTSGYVTILRGSIIGSGGGTVDVSIQQFRLTTETGVSVSTSDRTSQSTIYLTPHVGNQIALYDGSAWQLRSTAEVSLALSGLTSGKNYDVFAYYTGSAVALELSAAWTTDTARADAITRQDGVYVKSGTATRRLIGTIRTTGTTTTEDSGGGTTTQVGGKRFVWNVNNQVPRHIAVLDTTDSWTYGTNSWRALNNTAANRVEYVCGLAGASLRASAAGCVYLDGASEYAALGIGLDATTSSSSQSAASAFTAAAQLSLALSANYSGPTALGYHYIAVLERALTGTVTFDSGAVGAGPSCGLSAEILG